MSIEALERCREAVETTRLFALLMVSVNIPGCAGVRGQRLDGMPRGGNDETRAAVERLEYYSKMFDQWSAKTEALKAEVESIIVSLMEDEKALMRLYYCEAMSDSGCAAQMGWKRRASASDKRREILRKLEQKLDRTGLDVYNGRG